jgi:hypothetical protein
MPMHDVPVTMGLWVCLIGAPRGPVAEGATLSQGIDMAVANRENWGSLVVGREGQTAFFETRRRIKKMLNCGDA